VLNQQLSSSAVITAGMCQNYFSVLLGNQQVVNPGFLNDLTLLPVVYDSASHVSFVRRWGTHYVDKIYYGVCVEAITTSTQCHSASTVAASFQSNITTLLSQASLKINATTSTTQTATGNFTSVYFNAHGGQVNLCPDAQACDWQSLLNSVSADNLVISDLELQRIEVMVQNVYASVNQTLNIKQAVMEYLTSSPQLPNNACPTTTSPSPDGGLTTGQLIGIIIGSVIGGLLVIALIAFGVCLYKHQK